MLKKFSLAFFIALNPKWVPRLMILLRSALCERVTIAALNKKANALHDGLKDTNKEDLSLLGYFARESE